MRKIETAMKRLEKAVLAHAHAVGMEWDERKARELIAPIAEELLEAYVRQEISQMLGLKVEVPEEDEEETS